VPATARGVGELEQKAGPAGCLSETLAECTPARALLLPVDVAVAPDARTVYAVAYESYTVAVFRRNPTTGELSQHPGPQGCVSLVPAGDACTRAVADGRPLSLAVSPDGRSVYVISSGGITILDRDPLTGELRPKVGADGCIVGEHGPSSCARGFLLDEPRDVVVSPDGRSVYVATLYGVLGFARHPLTGTLTQRRGPGCIITGEGDQCPQGRLLGVAISLGVSPDGRSLYVATESEFDAAAIAVLDVTPASGRLEQKPGAAGCVVDVTYGPSVGCGLATGLSSNPLTALVSPDGDSVYVGRPGGLVVFDRAADGRLRQKAGSAGCFSADGDVGSCTLVSSFSAQSLAASPSGLSLYASSGARDSLWSFDRAASGALTMKPGLTGCISDIGGPACRDGRALDGPVATAISPDGGSLYTASASSNAVAVFDRDRSGEALGAPDNGDAGDTIAPSVTRLRLSPHRFRVGRRPTPVAARSSVAAGSTFRFHLSERADLRIRIARARPGRLSNGRCRANSWRLSRRPRCVRWRTVGVLRRHDQAAGPVKLRFSGRIGRRPLKPDFHRATVVATDGAGNRSAARRARFAILARQTSRPRAEACAAGAPPASPSC
jgi:DNA-binding beta-propeller fold protein YncE